MYFYERLSKMKKALLISSVFVFSSFITYEKAEAMAGLGKIFDQKKEDSKSSDVSNNAFHEIAKRAESISTSADNLIKKSYVSSDDDITSLLGFVAFTKDISALFYWVSTMIDELKSSLDKIQQAQNDEDQEELAAAKKQSRKIIQILLGNGMRSLKANAKASATIYIQMMQSLRFSNAGMETLKKEMADLVEQCGRIRTAKQLLRRTIENTFKALEENPEEITNNELDQLIIDIGTFVDILEKINTYFIDKALPPEDIDKLLKECSLADPKNNSDIDESYDEEKDIKDREITIEEDDEEDADIQDSKTKEKNKAKKNKKLKKSEQVENEDSETKANKKKPKKKKKTKK
ncbi:MAG: hypothetical protein LBQ08_03585 [Holosporaceae bacterium]|nr:hypothetical protein [Holosporaceae bacterium]